MNESTILKYAEAILPFLTLLLGLAATYFRYNSKLQLFVMKQISEAENQIKGYKQGGERFKYVVDKTYEWLPSWAKIIFTKEVISNIVQYLFDTISSYAVSKLDNVVNVLIEETEGDGQ